MRVWFAFSFCWWHMSHGAPDDPGALALEALKQAALGRAGGITDKRAKAPGGVLAGSGVGGARMVRAVAYAGALLAGVVAAAA